MLVMVHIGARVYRFDHRGDTIVTYDRLQMNAINDTQPAPEPEPVGEYTVQRLGCDRIRLMYHCPRMPTLH